MRHLKKLFGLFVLAIALAGTKLQAVSHRLGAEFLKTIEAADDDLPRPVGRTTRHRARAWTGRGQLGLGTILAAFTVVIAAFVVLIVVDTFDQSTGTPSSSSLSNAQGDILSGFGSMMSLIQPLLLIAIGVVIIGLIRRVQ